MKNNNLLFKLGIVFGFIINTDIDTKDKEFIIKTIGETKRLMENNKIEVVYSQEDKYIYYARIINEYYHKFIDFHPIIVFVSTKPYEAELAFKNKELPPRTNFSICDFNNLKSYSNLEGEKIMVIHDLK